MRLGRKKYKLTKLGGGGAKQNRSQKSSMNDSSLTKVEHDNLGQIEVYVFTYVEIKSFQVLL